MNAAGVTVAIASGRPSNSIASFISQLSLSQPVVPAIVYNGSVGVLYRSDGTVLQEIFSTSISPRAAAKILDLVQKRGEVAQYYNKDSGEIFAAPTTPEHRELCQRIGHPQRFCVDYSEAVQLSPAAKILALTRDTDSLAQDVADLRLADQCHIIRGVQPFFVEFLPGGSCKGTGLLRLAQYLSVDLGRVVAFGNGDNDIDMLKAAGRGCAVANASPACKAAADVVLPLTNAQDGVAEYLEQLLQSGHFASALRQEKLVGEE